MRPVPRSRTRPGEGRRRSRRRRRAGQGRHRRQPRNRTGVPHPGDPRRQGVQGWPGRRRVRRRGAARAGRGVLRPPRPLRGRPARGTRRRGVSLRPRSTGAGRVNAATALAKLLFADGRREEARELVDKLPGFQAEGLAARLRLEELGEDEEALRALDDGDLERAFDLLIAATPSQTAARTTCAASSSRSSTASAWTTRWRGTRGGGWRPRCTRPLLSAAPPVSALRGGRWNYPPEVGRVGVAWRPGLRRLGGCNIIRTTWFLPTQRLATESPCRRWAGSIRPCIPGQKWTHRGEERGGRPASAGGWSGGGATGRGWAATRPRHPHSSPAPTAGSGLRAPARRAGMPPPAPTGAHGARRPVAAQQLRRAAWTTPASFVAAGACGPASRS